MPEENNSHHHRKYAPISQLKDYIINKTWENNNAYLHRHPYQEYLFASIGQREKYRRFHLFNNVIKGCSTQISQPLQKNPEAQ